MVKTIVVCDKHVHPGSVGLQPVLFKGLNSQINQIVQHVQRHRSRQFVLKVTRTSGGIMTITNHVTKSKQIFSEAQTFEHFALHPRFILLHFFSLSSNTLKTGGNYTTFSTEKKSFKLNLEFFPCSFQKAKARNRLKDPM